MASQDVAFVASSTNNQPQCRAEAFNAFHTPILTTVGRVLTTTALGVNPALGNVGVVTGTADARVLQLALKVTF